MIFFSKSGVRFEIWTLLFFRASEVGWKTSNLNVDSTVGIREEFGVYVKLSILSIGGPRLIFINTTKCPTKLLIKK